MSPRQRNPTSVCIHLSSSFACLFLLHLYDVIRHTRRSSTYIFHFVWGHLDGDSMVRRNGRRRRKRNRGRGELREEKRHTDRSTGGTCRRLSIGRQNRVTIYCSRPRPCPPLTPPLPPPDVLILPPVETIVMGAPCCCCCWSGCCCWLIMARIRLWAD